MERARSAGGRINRAQKTVERGLEDPLAHSEAAARVGSCWFGSFATIGLAVIMSGALHAVLTHETELGVG